MSILPPDHYTVIMESGMHPVIGFLWFAVQLYGTMFIFLILNTLLTASVCWSLLIIFRLLGIPWIDGTTKGLINRE